MATAFQVKVHGKWRDIELPWVDLDQIVLAVHRDGGEAPRTRLNEDSMKPFLDMAKEKWGDVFMGTMVAFDDKLPFALTWDCLMVLKARPDLLKIGVCWETAKQLPSTLKPDGTSKENWVEDSDFVEITILPGN
jgi:hypothetical protein